jgi:hypothetical protein
MKIVLQVNGGIGKSIMATAVCSAIKKHFPAHELIVISGYPEVFAPNPNVSMSLSFQNLHYFYPQHIHNQDTLLFLHDPYHTTDFVYKRGHLIAVWCALCGVPYNGELPELYLTAKEHTQYGPMFASPKPLLVMQTNGGISPQGDKYSWPRDLPIATAQRVVNAMAADYNIVHIRRQDQLALQGVYPVQADFRALAVLIAMSAKRLFIDSFAQHTAAALCLPSVVCWVANTPTQFGYAMHTNVLAAPPTLKPELRHSVFSQYNLTGQVTEFPYRHEDEIFHPDFLIAALRGEVGHAATAPQEEGVLQE